MTPAAGCTVPLPPWVPTSADGDWVVQHPVNEALGLASAALEPAVDETDDPGDWSFATIPLAAAMADLRGVGYCHRTVQFLNDRLWPGFKGSDGADGRVWIMSDCPCCGLARDTQDHGILRCPHPTLQAPRSSTFASIQVIIETLPVQHQWAAEQIVHMAKAEDGYRLCLGIWTSASIQLIEVPEFEIARDQLPGVLWAIHRPLAELVGALWDVRARMAPFSPPPRYSFTPWTGVLAAGRTLPDMGCQGAHLGAVQLPVLSVQHCAGLANLQQVTVLTSQEAEAESQGSPELSDNQPPVGEQDPHQPSQEHEPSPLPQMVSELAGLRPSPAPSRRSSKVVLLRGGMNQGHRSLCALTKVPPLLPSPMNPPLLNLCRPTHSPLFQVTLDADWRPYQLRGFGSAVTWLGPHFNLGLWPISLPTLQALVVEASLATLEDMPIVETLHGLVTSEALIDVVSGGPISNLIVDFIGDLIFDSGVRCLVLDSVTASALYTSGQWPDGTPSWSDYDAVLIPFLDEAHWRLAVADLTTATLYYLDPDVDLAWTPRHFVKDWLAATGGGRWQQVMWDAPQQCKGAKDCAIAVLAFMLHVARGDGLPFRGSSSVAALRVHPSYTPGGLTHMRGRIFVSLLCACLDPPSDPSALSQDLKALYISCQSDVTSSPGDQKQDDDDSRTGARKNHMIMKLNA